MPNYFHGTWLDDSESPKPKRLELLSVDISNASGVKLGHFLIISNINTVEPPVSDHPKCQAKVVAYRWSQPEVDSILYQLIIISMEYDWMTRNWPKNEGVEYCQSL